MPGTQILWVPDFFLILEHSITFCSYILWVQEDGRRARIVYPVEKIWMQQGLNLRLQGERPAPKPPNYEDLLIY
jgi:hypothetical protein